MQGDPELARVVGVFWKFRREATPVTDCFGEGLGRFVELLAALPQPSQAFRGPGLEDADCGPLTIFRRQLPSDGPLPFDSLLCLAGLG
jgi:hypothetical protein